MSANAFTLLEADLTCPEVSKKLRIGPDKVRQLIISGELRAKNVASRSASRPRYRITREDLAAFERARAVVPATQQRARRATASRGKSYFG